VIKDIQRTPVCDECPGRCCTKQRWIFSSLTLTDEEAALPRFREHAEKDFLSGDWRISLRPKCPFLGKNNRCTIYRHRPGACKGYVCYHDPMIETRLKDYPTHRRLLNRWKVLPGQKYGIEKHETEDQTTKTKT